SQEAVAQAQRNAEHNGLKAEFIAANVFDFFHEKKNETWDLIVLDPPPFAKTKEKTEDALRGYKELNLRAMQRLSSGGALATYCCSHHISKEMFESMLRDAAGDAERDARILCRCAQPADHPVLLNVPESEYVHGVIVEAD
ncbi:MAG: methyltransferase, partial [bacterium]